MGSIGMPELIIILVIILVVFGAGKLPQVGDALGKGIKNFRKASKDLNDTTEEQDKDESQDSEPDSKA